MLCGLSALVWEGFGRVFWFWDGWIGMIFFGFGWVFIENTDYADFGIARMGFVLITFI